MKIRFRHMPLVALAVGIFPPAAKAQYKCDAPTGNAWLKRPDTNAAGAETHVTGVKPVSHNVEKAIARLDHREFAVLNRHELVEFGGQIKSPPGGKRSRPYLVRAVFPTTNPMLTVTWIGADLHVFAAGLGCEPYVKHPVLLFLDRKPGRVFVGATAAL